MGKAGPEWSSLLRVQELEQCDIPAQPGRDENIINGEVREEARGDGVL